MIISLCCPLPRAGGRTVIPGWRERREWAGRLGIIIPIILLATVSRPAAAEEEAGLQPVELKKLSLEELMSVQVPTVYGASKHEQSVTEAPSSVSVVTREQIQKFGYRTLADLLRSVRGFYVTYDRSYSYIGVRGVNRLGDYGGRILITINGHRLNDPLYDQASNGGEFPLDVDLIERVEVIRGPGSSLYGNNAFFAVINVVTRAAQEVGGAEISGAVASYDTYSGRFTYGNRLTNGVSVLISGSLLDSQGHDRLYFQEYQDINQGWSERLDDETRKQLFASVSYRDLILEGAYGDRKKDLPSAAYGTAFNVRPNFTVDERSYLEARYRHEFAGEWQVQSRLYLDRYRYDAQSPYEDELDPTLIDENIDYALSHSWGGEVQVSKAAFEKHRFTFGAEFRHDFQLDQQNFYRGDDQKYADISDSGASFGFYFQDEYAVLTNLTLNAGARYDYVLDSGSTINPRAGLIFHPFQPTTFKLLYGQAYRAPNAYERDYVAPGYVGNPGLQPERIYSYELVWEQAIGKQWRWSSSLFYNQVEDLITQNINDSGDYQFFNTDAVDIRGVEAELEGAWIGGVRTRGSYAYSQAVDKQSHQFLPNTPRHLAQLAVSIPVYREKVFASWELRGMSSRGTVDGGKAGGVVLADLTLFSRELVKGLELSAGVYNLFDTRYRDPVGVDFDPITSLEQEGRTFRVKVTYRF